MLLCSVESQHALTCSLFILYRTRTVYVTYTPLVETSCKRMVVEVNMFKCMYYFKISKDHNLQFWVELNVELPLYQCQAIT